MRTEVFSVGDEEFGVKVYINHQHNQVDVEVIDCEPNENKPNTALVSLTTDELKTLANILINLDFTNDKYGSLVK